MSRKKEPDSYRQALEQAEQYRSPFLSPDEARERKVPVSQDHSEWDYYRNYYAGTGQRALEGGWSTEDQDYRDRQTLDSLLSNVSLSCPPSWTPLPGQKPAVAVKREYPVPLGAAVLAGFCVTLFVSALLIIPFSFALSGHGSPWSQLATLSGFPVSWAYATHYIRRRRWTVLWARTTGHRC